MKEIHNSIDKLVFALNYKEYQWLICKDLEVVRLVLQL